MLIKTKGSMGEQMIDSILSFNNITFIREFTFKNLIGTIQRMDFYVTKGDKKYCIEFHGEQHYKTKGVFSVRLEEQKNKDLNKKLYCKEHGIEYVEIPYTENTLEKVFAVLYTIFPDIKKPSTFTVHHGVEIDVQEMMEYYKEHTRKETAEKFGIPAYTVGNILTNVEYQSKRVKLDLIQATNKKTGEIFEGTYKDIKENLPVTMSNVIKCLNGSMDSSSGYTFNYLDEEKDKKRQDAVTERKRINKEKLKTSKYKKTPIVMIDVSTGEETNFNSMKEAEETTGIKGISTYIYSARDRGVLHGKMFKTVDGDYRLSLEEARSRTQTKDIVGFNNKTNHEVEGTVNEVARMLEVSASNISKVLKGKTKTCKGYTFQYKNNKK